MVLACAALAGMALVGRPVSAQTYVSAEPIPSNEIVGNANLAKIESLRYPKLAVWSRRLLDDCHIVQNVIDTLSANGAISTINSVNTRYSVAAGGFQAVTDPSYVLRIEDSGSFAASQADIFVLDNALGYVLNQGGTAQFSLVYNPNNAYTFSNAYAVVSFDGPLTGVQAQAFFNYLGTIDPALWSGTNAGFTQIGIDGFGLNNSMLFLIGNVSRREFANGLFQAASTTTGAKYTPLGPNGTPITLTAGAAFPGNDWTTNPGGEGYLSNLNNPSTQLLNALAALRQKDLEAVFALLKAIDGGSVDHYLNSRFTCP